MLFLKPSKLALELKESGQYPNTNIVDLRIRGQEPLPLPLPYSKYVLLMHYTVIVEMEIDPNVANVTDRRYILFSTDEKKSYFQELSVKDNLTPKENKILLEFIDIKPKLNYSFIIESEKIGETHIVFEELPFDNLNAKTLKLVCPVFFTTYCCDSSTGEVETDYLSKTHILLIKDFSDDGSVKGSVVKATPNSKGQLCLGNALVPLLSRNYYFYISYNKIENVEVITKDLCTDQIEITDEYNKSYALPDDKIEKPKTIKIKLSHGLLQNDSENEKYTLCSADGSYSKELTVKKDKKEADGKIILEFEDVIEGLNYSLETRYGSSKKTFLLFENIPYRDLI